MPARSLSLAAALLCTPLAAIAAEPMAAEHFKTKVAPIFERRCLSCHNAADKKGGLSLETAETAKKGGENGDALAAGDPGSSYLLDLITPKNGQAQMPQKADALKPDEIAAITTWIKQGAVWPAEMKLAEAKVLNTDWWSLKPLVRPAVPAGAAHPVDAFVRAKLAEKGLQPSPEADRRTLIRRLSFDLLGLPPSPEEVDAFVADADPRAYEKLVDKLLASPQYGERWARHWLDVVHFGETHGYDKDQPRRNAWPYRDYVIRAFNNDKPYSRFVAEQIAGDVLYPDTADGYEALGFIAAGPWDLIGHAEVPESKLDGKIARHLDRDDMISNTINTFNSLTVQCAQCHNHKFDPISQDDYYSLQAVFAALDRSDQMYDVDPAVRATRKDLAAKQRELETRQKTQQAEIAKLVGKELADLDQRIKTAGKPAGATPPEHGYHSGLEASADKEKWVQVDLGEAKSIDKLTYIACHDDFGNIGAGFGFPLRFKIEGCNEPTFKTEVVSLVSQLEADVVNPGTTPQTAAIGGKTARYVRFTATRLANRVDSYIFALAELQVLDREGKNLAAGASVTALDSIEAPGRWRKLNLTDGIYPHATPGAADVAALKAQREKLYTEKVSAELRDAAAKVEADLAAVKAEQGKLPPGRVVYSGMIVTGGGAFSGTGPFGGKPRPIHLLPRGDIKRPGAEVGPGALVALTHAPARFDLSRDQPEGERRAALAKWIVDANNPLTWRSIVNRVWLYHFGRGIVDTPNDFGRMGQLPTHPELLDWLAVEFRDGGQSLKQLHRLLVTSATYKQSSAAQSASDGAKPDVIDADNRYYWRANRRRLEAEAIRDSILAASGKLDLTMGGPSFQDFVIEHPEHSPHYLYEKHNPDDPKSHRRSVYRFLVRSQTQPFMTTLDCADPSMLVDKRNQTITPLQALTLLNNQLTVAMAKHFAARAEKAGTTSEAQVTAAFRYALGRSPTEAELPPLAKYAREHGLANACRAIFNLNEFVFVD